VTTPTDLWGPFALRVRCGPLELRVITDDDIPAIVDLVLAGVHDPVHMPFARPWTDAPSDRLPANTAAYYWSTRASFSPSAWTLDLAVRVDGELVGVQGFSATDYLVARTGETGSWLGSKFQGNGIGTAMRQAMCALLFDHLEAEEITSAAFTDNPASLAVSRKVGYTDNGTVRVPGGRGGPHSRWVEPPRRSRSACRRGDGPRNWVARTAACVRLSSPSLASRGLTRFFTVFGAKRIRSAISRLLSPSPSNPSTARSR
jgi:RimJ/RimL family protein N-acetyltransferase